VKYASKFHEAVVAYLCVNFIPDDEVKTLKTVFRYIDRDNKSIITKEAVKQCLDEIDVDITNEKLKQMFDSIDENGSGLIEYQEFISKACDIKTLKSKLYLNIYFTYSKVIFKSSNNNFNNLDYNINNESANYNSINISKSTKIDGRKLTKLKYHISSNSIISNNINNINNQINNYQILHYMI
jgi:hypothetical protein